MLLKGGEKRVQDFLSLNETLFAPNISSNTTTKKQDTDSQENEFGEILSSVIDTPQKDTIKEKDHEPKKEKSVSESPEIVVNQDPEVVKTRPNIGLTKFVDENLATISKWQLQNKHNQTKGNKNTDIPADSQGNKQAKIQSNQDGKVPQKLNQIKLASMYTAQLTDKQTKVKANKDSNANIPDNKQSSKQANTQINHENKITLNLKQMSKEQKEQMQDKTNINTDKKLQKNMKVQGFDQTQLSETKETRPQSNFNAISKNSTTIQELPNTNLGAESNKSLITSSSLKPEPSPASNSPWNIVQQIVSKTQTFVDQNKTFMEIQLKPEFLGKVKVHLSYVEGVVTASLLTDKSHTGSLLNSTMQQIKSTLQEQGIKVEYLGVDVSHQEEPGTFKEGHQHHQNQKSNKRFIPQGHLDNQNLEISEQEFNQYHGELGVNYLA